MKMFLGSKPPVENHCYSRQWMNLYKIYIICMFFLHSMGPWVLLRGRPYISTEEWIKHSPLLYKSKEIKLISKHLPSFCSCPQVTHSLLETKTSGRHQAAEKRAFPDRMPPLTTSIPGYH